MIEYSDSHKASFIYTNAGILRCMRYVTQLKININELKDEDSNNYVQEKFISTYNWAGLLLLFIALWISSFWGFDFNLKGDEGGVIELWLANLLFIGTSVGAMFYGAKTEQKIFFNYGLVFLIIETYAVICGRMLEYMPAGIGALLIGGLLIGTAKILQKVYLKKVK